MALAKIQIIECEEDEDAAAKDAASVAEDEDDAAKDAASVTEDEDDAPSVTEDEDAAAKDAASAAAPAAAAAYAAAPAEAADEFDAFFLFVMIYKMNIIMLSTITGNSIDIKFYGQKQVQESS